MRSCRISRSPSRSSARFSGLEAGILEKMLRGLRNRVGTSSWRLQAAWRTCSAGRPRAWIWPAVCGPLMSWFWMKQTDFWTWGLRQDAGSGEPGESRPPEPCPHLREGEGPGRQQHPEDPLPPGELLHGEPWSCFSLVPAVCKADEKFNQLVHFLRNHKQEKHLVFFSTCACVEYYGKALEALVKSVKIMCIHGKMKYKRNKIFMEFRKLPSGILVCTDVMARGIDIPEVNWVLQYDPPSNASAFVHRCGRTARIGHGGSALVFLLPMEESYINFLAINQKCPLQEMKLQKNTMDLLPKLQSMALADRAVFEKGMKAFVSYVQAYAKHECSLIFRLKDLDFARLARGFALLRMPKMPELRGKQFPDFVPVDVNTDTIPFKDKIREKQRQKLLEQQRKEKTANEGRRKFIKNKAWSKQKAKKEKKKKMNEKRKREEGSDIEDEDMEELLNDTRLLKKFKKGKITEEEFEKGLLTSGKRRAKTADLGISDSEDC
ncbi:ATP-dependent RNA helicase DDX55 isoform X3 [Equus asinus]|uniref:ATP-dependent RNA helicase DDX55 isoform X3 n=1 Tax=Equus asinus TaxID=9793 RepID=UPI001D041E36|nr:ATP-dependent RNA helicase DDX55 isoform X3 [Equus asinus]